MAQQKLKEKAEELIQKMAISISWGTNYTGADDIPIYKNQYAKQCALITVDEILNLLKIDLTRDSATDEVVMYASSRILYWDEVKQEIEKL